MLLDFIQDRTFTIFCFSIKTTIFFQARDADKTSQITYSIVGGNEHQLFDIDKHSGEITVADARGLDMSDVNMDYVNLIIQVTKL